VDIGQDQYIYTVDKNQEANHSVIQLFLLASICNLDSVTELDLLR